MFWSDEYENETCGFHRVFRYKHIFEKKINVYFHRNVHLVHFAQQTFAFHLCKCINLCIWLAGKCAWHIDYYVDIGEKMQHQMCKLYVYMQQSRLFQIKFPRIRWIVFCSANKYSDDSSVYGKSNHVCGGGHRSKLPEIKNVVNVNGMNKCSQFVMEICVSDAHCTHRWKFNYWCSRNSKEIYLRWHQPDTFTM